MFARLSDGFGDIRCRVRMVDARDGATVLETAERVLSFRDRRQTLYANLRLANLTWSGPGEFVVELYCDGEFVDDATLSVFQ
ncbi:MAG: hypothetical protein C0501_19145 [Isosphaera sp.]|nr:hypothetical protein [Isosphaera sp.]